MRKFIFAERNGIHIIDLRKTLDRLNAAQQAVREVVLRGERVLFVCTKRQLGGVVEQEAARCGAFFVTERWLGGMLTNFQTIRKQIRRLRELERGQEEQAFEFYTKKERLLIERERIKLEKYLSGVKEKTRLPGAVFVVDARRETIAVREAHRLGIPVIAITDTNADPDLIDYPVPGNDDAIRSVSLICKVIADAVEVARREVPAEELKRVAELEATTYSTETGEVKEVEDRSRSRPKRKRRPRPEAIAERRKPGEGEVVAEVADAPAAATKTESPEASTDPAEVTPEAEATESTEAVSEAAPEDGGAEDAAAEDDAQASTAGEE